MLVIDGLTPAAIRGLLSMREVVEIVNGIRVVAKGLVEAFKHLLPRQRKTRRGNLVLELELRLGLTWSAFAHFARMATD